MRRQTAACMVLFAGLFAAREGEAQCGALHSSCSACHDGMQAQAPGHEAWHDNHAFADLCPTCHGGRGEANDLAEAHVGLVEPLQNPEAQCGSCHGASTQAFVERYRVARSREADAGAAVATRGPRDAMRPPSNPRKQNAHGDPGPNRAMTAAVATVGTLGILFIVRQERARRRRAEPPAVHSASPI
jgi:hypothetical protein